MEILNLTQHTATAEQVAAGVVELNQEDKVLVQSLLTFEEIPSMSGIFQRADKIARLAKKYNIIKAMIGGAPYLMSELEKALMAEEIVPLYSFSVRSSTEKLVDGKIIKTNVFIHVGFIEVE
jgi:hypothetical protein